MQIIQIVKEHPAPFAIGGVLLLVLLMRSSSSGSQASTGPIVDNSAQMASINAGMAVQLGAQSTDRFNVSEQAALQRTGIAASLMSAMVTSNAGLQASSAAVSASTVAKALDASTARQQMQTNADIQQKTIAANIQENSDTLTAQINMHANDNNAKLSAIGLQTQGQLAAMHLQGDLSTQQLGMNLNWQAQSLPQILQNQQEMARITGQNAIQIANVNAKAADINAKAQSDSSGWSTAVSVIGTVAELFA